jgi:hypothetical protein
MAKESQRGYFVLSTYREQAQLFLELAIDEKMEDSVARWPSSRPLASSVADPDPVGSAPFWSDPDPGLKK